MIVTQAREEFVKIRREVHLSSDVLVAAEVFLQKLVVFHADELVAAPRLEKLLKTREDRITLQHKHVGPEVCNVLGNVVVHAVDHGHDHDQCGCGDNHAEQSKEGAEFVRT